MEPQISDTKHKPMRYAGFLSFLEKFISVPNQSNQVWRLRLLIMAVAVGILFYPDNLCEAKRIQGPLDSHLKDFCYPLLPASLIVNFSGFNDHQISLPEHNTGKVESVVDLTLGPNRSDQILRWFNCSSSGLVITESVSRWTPSRTNHQISLPEHNTGAGESVDLSGRPFNNLGSVFTESGSHIQVSPPSRTNHQISLPEHNTGAVESVIGIVLGPNRSDPVWQLRLLAAFSLVVHATMSVLFLPRDLQGVDATCRRVMLITNFAAPIVIAVITLLISLWVESDRDGDSNWITGLSVANFSTLGGRLAVYWAFKRETWQPLPRLIRFKKKKRGNLILRSQESYREDI